VKKSILTISRDEHLQFTRTLLLEANGYHVAAALDDKEALRFVEAPNTFALVLLCHSVPERSRLLHSTRIRELRPGLPILMLYDGYEPTNAHVDGSLQNLSGPEAVLNMIGFLTQHVTE
jgi:DNA-binding response OmpR family regulator